MNQHETLTETLRRHGYRVTPPRETVWRVLSESAGHLTADEIAARINRTQTDVNLASIYRALGLLEDLELVRASRLGPEASTTWEVAHPDEHFHLVCDSCGDVEHHQGTLVDQIEQHLRDGHGFEPSTVELVVTGRCRDCRKADR